MFGHKKIEALYEARLGELVAAHQRELLILEARIADLRQLVMPPRTYGQVPLISAETDAILTPGVDQLEMTAAQMKEYEENASEADRILSGNY